MQILSATILQFIFIFLSLIIEIPGLDKYNILKNKLILFCGIFIFQTVINTISKIRSRCTIRPADMINDSFFVSLLSIIGYSIYIDLLTMNNTRKLIQPYLRNKHLTAFIISIVIVTFIFFIKIFKFVVGGQEECSKNINEYEII